MDDLKDFNVREVYIAGELVAKEGKALFDVNPLKAPLAILRQEPKASGVRDPAASDPSAKVRVIRVRPKEIESKAETAMLKVSDDIVRPDPARGINLIAVVNRYREAPVAVALVSGFDLKRGAMASTVAHDSHNIIAVGADAASLAEAVNRVSEQGGYYITDGERNESMRLPIAGLMSASPCRGGGGGGAGGQDGALHGLRSGGAVHDPVLPGATGGPGAQALRQGACSTPGG